MKYYFITSFQPSVYSVTGRIPAVWWVVQLSVFRYKATVLIWLCTSMYCCFRRQTRTQLPHHYHPPRQYLSWTDLPMVSSLFQRKNALVVTNLLDAASCQQAWCKLIVKLTINLVQVISAARYKSANINSQTGDNYTTPVTFDL